jgi:hypothetical protein
MAKFIDDLSTAIRVFAGLGGVIALAWAVQRLLHGYTAQFMLISTGVVCLISFLALLIVILTVSSRG